jgi:prepilin-type N-terminal cleavage/methylation domain-containing protein
MFERTRITNRWPGTTSDAGPVLTSFATALSTGARERRVNRQGGFSATELVIVVVVFAIIIAIAIPQAVGILRSNRVLSDTRSIASQLALAKMRAADGFTQTQLSCDTTANTCQLQVCTSKGAGGCNTFSNEGGPVLLSQGVSFGFGNLTTPAGSQTTIQNTTQIAFNSRSIPVDNTGAPTGNYGLYLTDQSGNTYAVTVYASGRIAVWRYGNGVWSIQ